MDFKMVKVGQNTRLTRELNWHPNTVVFLTRLPKIPKLSPEDGFELDTKESILNSIYLTIIN